MAFDIRKLQYACASMDASVSVKMCTYRTTDSDAIVKTVGYFDNAPVGQGDVIFVQASNKAFFLRISNAAAIGKTVSALDSY